MFMIHVLFERTDWMLFSRQRLEVEKGGMFLECFLSPAIFLRGGSVFGLADINTRS